MYNEYEEEEEIENTSSGNKVVDFYNNNKKLVWVVLGMILFIIILSLFSGKSSSSKSTDLVILYDNSPITEKTISKGTSIKLSTRVGNKKNSYIKWSSSNSNIASVDDVGIVRGKAVGKVDIQAIYDNNGSAITKTCTITVADGDPNIRLTAAALPDGDLMMGVGTQYSLSVTIRPEKGYVSNQQYTSSDISVVTVDDSGKVMAVGKGQARVSVSVNNGEFTDDIMVYVSDNMSTAKLSINIQKITFQNAVEKIEVGKMTQLTFDKEPQDGDMTSVIWKSNNESVVKVDEKTGALTGVNLGTALVKVYSLSGTEIAYVTVEVVESLNDVTSISLPYPSITLTVGGSQTITPTVKPDNASNKGLTYSSSNPSVASVTPVNNGISATINAISSGTAVITISSSNGKTQTLTVNVNSSSGGSSGGGYTYDEHDDKGYNISSKDSENKGVVCRSYDKTSKSENIGKGSIVVTFKITSSSTSSLKVCKYKYGGTACDPDNASTAGVTEIKKDSANSIRIDNEGVWVIVVSEYNGTKRKSTLSWYARLDDATGRNSSENDPVITCCYKNSSGTYVYGAIQESKCYNKTDNRSNCTARNTTTPTDTKVTCCYKNSSGDYAYGSVKESSCVNRTDDQTACLARNKNYTEKCCYKKSGTWVNEEVDSGTCASKTGPGELNRTDSQCSAKNSQTQTQDYTGLGTLSLSATGQNITDLFGYVGKRLTLSVNGTYDTVYFCVDNGGGCSVKLADIFKAVYITSYTEWRALDQYFDPVNIGYSRWTYANRWNIFSENTYNVKQYNGAKLYVLVANHSNGKVTAYSNYIVSKFAS